MVSGSYEWQGACFGHGTPMLAVARPSIPPSSPPTAAVPEIHAVSFATATIRTGRVAAARIECSGILPEDIRCEATRPGFLVEILPPRMQQGRCVILAIRVHRRPGTPRGLCLVRFSAGATCALASLTVLPR